MSVSGLLREAGMAWKALQRSPAFLLLAVLTLALGIGATATVHALLHQVVLRPLPYPQPEQLVVMGMQVDGDQTHELQRGAPVFYDALEGLPSLQSRGMVATAGRDTNLARGDTSEVVRSLAADRGFVQTLGVPLHSGRNFTAGEDTAGGPPAVIISHRLWQRLFQADTQAVGQLLQIEGRATEVVGVLPAHWSWPEPFDLLLPMQPESNSRSMASNEYLIGRIADNVPLAHLDAQVQAALWAVIDQMITGEQEREALQHVRLGAQQLSVALSAGTAAGMLWMFMAAAACLLLIAGFNLANLLLQRHLQRAHEQSIRAALGAPSWALLAPALAETMWIALIGSVLGLLLAWLAIQLLTGVLPAQWLGGRAPGLSVAVVGGALLMASLVALGGASLGLLSGRSRQALAHIGRQAGSGLGRRAALLAKALVVAQVAAATVLLLSASLLAHSLWKLSQVPMGFASQDLVTFTLSPVKAQVVSAQDMRRQVNSVGSALQRIAGVATVSVSSNLPTGSQFNMYAEFDDGRGASVQFRPVTSTFHANFSIPVLAGRALAVADDQPGGQPVALVSQSFAREYLAGDAMGAHVQVNGRRLMVVGVVGDVRQFGPAQDVAPVVYVPLGQVDDRMWALMRQYTPLQYALAVAPGQQAAVMSQLSEAVAQAWPGQPISAIRTMQEVVDSTTSEQRLNLVLIGVFSLLSLVLATVGLYAVMSVQVHGRRQELGIRAALGASPARLLRLVAAEGGGQLLLGMAIGFGMALLAAPLLRRFLFEVGVADPWAVALVAAVLGAAGLLAVMIPALRAARVPAVQVLQAQ